MDTKTFNENYELDRKAKGIRASPKHARGSEEPEILTADGAAYDLTQTYYFFDEQNAEIHQSPESLGRRRDGDYICMFGLKVIPISKLRSNRDDAIADKRAYFKSEEEINPMKQNKPFETICEKCGKVHNRCTGHPKRKNTGGVFRPCNKFPVKGKKVCERCGGKTPGGIASPHFKDGKHSKHQYLPPNFSSRLETVVGDHIENIEHSIEIQKVLETTYLEKLSTTESTEAWRKLEQAVKDYQQAEDDCQQTEDDSKYATSGLKKGLAFARIRSIVEEGVGQSSLYRDIQRIQESQRRLTETLSKARKEVQEIYTHEQWNEMLSTLVVILKNNIQDPKILQAIQQDLYARGNSSEQNLKHLTIGRSIIGKWVEGVNATPETINEVEKRALEATNPVKRSGGNL